MIDENHYRNAPAALGKIGPDRYSATLVAPVCKHGAMRCECYNKGPIDRGACRPYGAVQRRGVAQPGRAPGSGPGGRRFKSSLPDQSFQTVVTISAGCNMGAFRATGNSVSTGMWKPS